METEITYPDLVTEIHRYSKPEDTFRFFMLEANDVDSMSMNYRPFQSRDIRGIDPSAQNYIETEREQINTEKAEAARHYLADIAGYRPVAFLDLPVVLAQFVCFNQAPIEWHSGLMSGDAELTKRITVWVRGEFPQ